MVQHNHRESFKHGILWLNCFKESTKTTLPFYHCIIKMFLVLKVPGTEGSWYFLWDKEIQLRPLLSHPELVKSLLLYSSWTPLWDTAAMSTPIKTHHCSATSSWPQLCFNHTGDPSSLVCISHILPGLSPFLQCFSSRVLTLLPNHSRLLQGPLCFITVHKGSPSTLHYPLISSLRSLNTHFLLQCYREPQV